MLLTFLLLFLLPLLLHAAWWTLQDRPASWGRARWESAGMLQPPAEHPGALVRVFAARTGGLKGIVAHHSWVVVKEQGAQRYTRYDVVGWGRPVRIDGWAADAFWYSNRPELVAQFDDEAADALIPRIRAAVEAYAWSDHGTYKPWPGPNSNTFVAHILRAIPEAGVALPPTALGKDYRDSGLFAGFAPSRTGLQVSVFGLLGLTAAWVEGIEVNVLGLVAGFDLRRPALKVPGFGRLGLATT